MDQEMARLPRIPRWYYMKKTHKKHPPQPPGEVNSLEFQTGYKLAQLQRKARGGALQGDDAMDFLDNEITHNLEKAAREFKFEKEKLLRIAATEGWRPLEKKIRKPALKAAKRLRNAKQVHEKFVDDWNNIEHGEPMDPKA